jgi:uncharacterized protein YlzI (FlbEa/FlbD family)
MWLSDLAEAIHTLFEKCGYINLVERIANNVITMSNGDKYIIHDGGKLEKVE